MSEQNNVNAMNREIIAQFRANGGKVVEGRFSDAKLLLLSTKGAKSGVPRTNPLMYYKDGERFVIFASHRGAATNPDWYHNLVANPGVTIEVGTDSFETQAHVATGEERQRIWDDALKLHPFLSDHQATTKGRRIPVVVLTPPVRRA